MKYDIPRSFRSQAVACSKLGSPFMVRLMNLFADRLSRGSGVADKVLDWEGDPRPQADNVSLRLAGALHALAIDGLALQAAYPPNEVSDDVLWEAIEDALATYETRILVWLNNAPQTNEVRRSAMILPALAIAFERFGCAFDLMEVGCSGGLNLFADKFRFELPNVILGDPASAVEIAPEWSGGMPPIILPNINRRAGVDLNPLNPCDETDRLRLLSYLWSDQPDRIERTKAAIGIAQENPPEMTRSDAGHWLKEELAKPATVGRFLFHTIAWQYFPQATSEMGHQAISSAARQATREKPLVHLSMEADGGDGALVTLTMWPDGETKEIARADFHGRWVNWTGL